MDHRAGPYATLERVRAAKPLVHHITNWVTIYDCAQMTRATGALPVMAHAEEEVEDMVSISSALVLNIGTLTPELVRAMVRAGRKANGRKIPVVLDAVGAGATPLRTNACKELMSGVRFSVVKGNAGEVATLAGAEAEVRGVESGRVGGDVAELAAGLAKAVNASVAVTGAVDIVTDGLATYRVANGSPMMGRVVGTGCMAGSVIAAFCAVEKDAALAAAHALACYGIAGQLAAEDGASKGPSSFKTAFIDRMESLSREDVDGLARIAHG
jgi:hydroxyethylthiazole kinase